MLSGPTFPHPGRVLRLLARMPAFAWLLPAMTLAQSGMPKLILPTANDALLRGDNEAFYQVVERNFKDVITYPWEGGQYGFVRDPVETPQGIVYVHFHEGIDIKPLRRDAA